MSKMAFLNYYVSWILFYREWGKSSGPKEYRDEKRVEEIWVLVGYATYRPCGIEPITLVVVKAEEIMH